MPGASDSKSDSGWIVPVCRLTKELGRKSVWGTNKATLVDHDGKISSGNCTLVSHSWIGMTSPT
eukprot:12742389-Prorocentrum_lima.AAC.1